MAAKININQNPKSSAYFSLSALAIIAAALVLALNYYFFDSGSFLAAESQAGQQADFTASGTVVWQKINTSFLKDDKFIGLKDSSFKLHQIEDLDIGKKNPFAGQ